jgi:hypothetical protein
MSERLDRALALLERLVVAAEAMAARDVKPTKPKPRPTITPEARHAAVRQKLRRAGALDR